MKNPFLQLSIVIILLLSANLHPQDKGSLRGYVTDSLSSEALPYANIVVIGTTFGASADIKGTFLIRGIPAKSNYIVKVSFLGYESKVLNVDIQKDEISQINVSLAPSNLQLQTVEKIGERYERPNEVDLGLQRLDIKDIEMLPKGVETDIFRSLQTLPGVQTTGDVSARYYVRGGSGNQNLVLLNGAPVYNPFHALGLFSILDPEMINALEFYKGGFTAEYGGRLSSVLNLVTKEGNKNSYSGNAAVSFLTGKAAVEGPIPGGSFMVTGRKSLFTAILNKFLNQKQAPFSFHDVSAKLNYTNAGAGALTKISLHGFNSMDALINNDPAKADYEWSNNIFGGYWFQAWEDVPIFSETSFSVSNFDAAIKPNFSNAKKRNNKVRDITFQTDFTNIFESQDEISVGYLFKSLQTDVGLENLQGNTTQYSDQSLHLSLFFKYKFLRFEEFGIDIGSRLNALSLTSFHAPVFEPRVNLTYNILPGLSLKGAWGIYTQELITMTNETEVISIFEPWLIVPDNLEVPRAIHYIGGIEFKRIENLTLSSEVYYKSLQSTAEINNKKADENDPDFITGSGEAYGLEFMSEYKTSDVMLSAAYTLSWVYRNINNWISYPKYDSRHSVNLNLNYNLGAGWSAGAVWIFNSGLPFTEIVGYYDKLYFDDLYTYGLYGYYQPFTVLGDQNLGRLPSYHRLDLNLTKKMQLFMLDMEFSLNILNAYNRKNIFYFERDTGERVNMLPLLPTATVRVEI